MKCNVKRTVYEDVETIKFTASKVLDAIDKSALQKSMRALIDCADCCIDVEGTYFE